MDPHPPWAPTTNGQSVSACRAAAHKAQTKLLQHQRLGHLSVPSNRAPCSECALAKGGKASAQSKRGPQHENSTPLFQLNVDFFGPVQESVRGSSVFLVVACDAIAYTWVYPLKHKSDCISALQEIVAHVRARDSTAVGEKVIHVIRSDNEPVFKSPQWDSALRGLGDGAGALCSIHAADERSG